MCRGVCPAAPPECDDRPAQTLTMTSDGNGFELIVNDDEKQSETPPLAWVTAILLAVHGVIPDMHPRFMRASPQLNECSSEGMARALATFRGDETMLIGCVLMVSGEIGWSVQSDKLKQYTGIWGHIGTLVWCLMREGGCSPSFHKSVAALWYAHVGIPRVICTPKKTKHLITDTFKQSC